MWLASGINVFPNKLHEVHSSGIETGRPNPRQVDSIRWVQTLVAALNSNANVARITQSVCEGTSGARHPLGSTDYPSCHCKHP